MPPTVKMLPDGYTQTPLPLQPKVLKHRRLQFGVCPRGDSNPHDFRQRLQRSPRLPISPLGPAQPNWPTLSGIRDSVKAK
jgi:hypothetical protein